MSKRALVLGAGFIGSNFIRYALGLGYHLTVLDHNDCPKEFEGQLVWVRGDLGDIDILQSVVGGAEIVFHFVSSTVPGDATDEGGELIQNVIQTLQLLKLCCRVKVGRIVFVSSSSVYGQQEELPISESASTNPISSHGIHKLTIEKYLQLYKYQNGLDCKILRLSNPYGPGQDINGRQGFIAIAIGKLLAGQPIEVRGDGTSVRDFVYIDDVVEALHLIATAEIEDTVINVGSGCGYTLNQIISIIERLVGKTIDISYIDSRYVDIPKSILDVSRAREILGQGSKTSIEDGIANTLAYHGKEIDS